MELVAVLGISNRHVHLTKRVFEELFGPIEIEKRSDLRQLGQFATNHVVTLKNGDKVLENVRVIGPFRPYNQVEISKTDAYTLKVNPPVRASGDIEKSESIEVIGPVGSVYLESSLIIANRHLHVNSSDLDKYKLKNNQSVMVVIGGEKSGVIEAFVKASEDGFLELHLDTDDANAFLLKNGMEISIKYDV